MRHGDRIEPGGRGKISPAVLFVKKVRIFKTCTLPSRLRKALTLTLTKVWDGAELGTDYTVLGHTVLGHGQTNIFRCTYQICYLPILTVFMNCSATLNVPLPRLYSVSISHQRAEFSLSYFTTTLEHVFFGQNFFILRQLLRNMFNFTKVPVSVTELK